MKKIKGYHFMLIVLSIGSMVIAQKVSDNWKITRAFPHKKGCEPVMVQLTQGKGKSIVLTYKLPNVKCEALSKFKRSKNKDFKRVILGSAPLEVKEGEPSLPVIPVKIIIPAGYTVENNKIQVKRLKRKILPETYMVEYGETPFPLLPGIKPKKAKPDSAIYSSNSPYPTAAYNLVGIQKKHGVHIAFINIYPVTYRPKSGKIIGYETISLTVPIMLNPVRQKQTARPRPERLNPEYCGIENPDVLKSYNIRSIRTYAPLGICDPAESYQYVIVTNQELRDATTDVTVHDLIAHRQAQGLTATIVAIEDILANYTGVDDAENLRNFIIDAYNNWETVYVLLGGDINIIPLRYLYADAENIPSDLYYQCLDGTYNSDGDSYWGEPTDGPGGSDVDLMAEIYVGRASAENADEMANFVFKTIAYETAPDGEPYLHTALMCGEHLGFGGPSEYAKPSMEEIRLGSSEHGYTTVGFAACPTFTVNTLYDQDGTWPKSEIIGNINSNTYSIINHLGHANTGYVMKFYNADADALSNNNFLFAYSQGCIPGDYSSDCIGEHLTTSNRHGMFAVVFNSRYGWGRFNSTDGPSQRFDRQFWDAYFGEFMFTLGAINADSHEDNIWDINGGRIRWCFYETNLLGDPCTLLRGQIFGPFVSYASHTFSDNPGGNGDGIINPGEQIALTATLVNNGSEAANDINAELSTTDNFITIQDNTASFGDIACCGSYGEALDDFQITVLPGCPTPYTATLDLNITDNESNSWTSSFSLDIYTSSQVSGYVRTFTGNNPVLNATVEYTGPVSGSIQTNAEGYYLFTGINGTYQITVTADNYLPSEPYEVSIPPDIENVDFELKRPVISYNPDHFQVALTSGSSGTHTLSLSNSGDADLEYVIICQSSSSSIPTDMLIAYWPFTEGTGSVLQDHFGDNNGSINGAQWIYDQRSALSFDGIDDHVTVAHPTDGSMDFGIGDFSVGLWINTTANTGTSGDRDDIIGKGDASINGFTISIRDNKPCIWLGSSTTPVSGSEDVNDGEWHLILGTRESGTVRLYVDGALVAEGTKSNSVTTAFDFLIGMHGTKSLCYYTGMIGSSYLYARALTEQEVIDIYTHGGYPWVRVDAPSGTVIPGSSVDIDVIFDASELFGGTYSGQLDIVHNDPVSTVPSVIPCELSVTGIKRLSVNPQSYDFGDVWIGLNETAIVTLTNGGSDATTVHAITSDNPVFTNITELPILVLPFEDVTFEVVFTPTDVQSEAGTITISSDAGDNPVITIDFSGTGTEAPQAQLVPTELTYTLQPNDMPADRTSVLTNIGGAPLAYVVTDIKEISNPLAVRLDKSNGSLPVVNDNLIYSSNNYEYPYVPGHVIVGLKEGMQTFADAAILSSIGTESVKELAQARNPVTKQLVNMGRKFLLIFLTDKTSEGVIQAIEQLRYDHNVAYAEPDYIQNVIAFPDDPDFSLLYGMHNTGQTGGTDNADIDAPEAWDKHKGNRNILIGVIDTGIEYTHPDLVANIWTNPGEIAGNGIDDDGNGFIDDIHGWDFAYDDNDPMDGHFHGTHCSGTIAGEGDNSIGVAGVMWEAHLVAIKFLSDGGSGTTSDAIESVNYATAMSVHVTSNSWGGGGFSQALMDAIAAGGLFIAAAGNSGSNNDVSPHYPSSYDLDNIIAVAATDHNDNRASFSCYGLTSVDLGAPGDDIYSCGLGGGYRYASGTSMATPHVTGAVGLVWSYNTFLSPLEVKQIIMDNVDPVSSLDGMVVTGGRLNVHQALNGAGPAWLSVVPLEPGELNPDENQVFTVTVDPAGLVAGQWLGEITIGTNDPDNPELSINVTADIAGCKSLTASPGIIDFEPVWVEQEGQLMLTLMNTCNTPVTVSSISFDNVVFSTSNTVPIVIDAFSETPIEIVFAPVILGNETGIMTIISDADDNPNLTINCSGMGVLPPQISVTPQSFNEYVMVGNSLTRIMEIHNSGEDDLTYSLELQNSSSDVPPPGELVAHWPFTEGTGTVLGDRTGSNNGTIIGAAWIQDQRMALSFDGSDDYVIIPHPPDGSMDFGTGNFSVGAWINTTASTGTGVNRDEIISKGDASINGFTISARQNKPCLWLYDSDNPITGTTQINDGQWHLVFAVRENGTAHLFVDGILEASESNNLSVTTPLRLYIGKHGTKDLCYFSGMISSCYLYGRALSEQEIIDLYYTGGVPWVRVEPIDGIVAPAAKNDISIFFNEMDFEKGLYQGQLLVNHNSPLSDAVIVPIDLHIVTTTPSDSRILTIGPSANPAAVGNYYLMKEIIIGSSTSGITQGNKYQLKLK